MLNDKTNKYFRITYFLSFFAYLKRLYRPSGDANLSRKHKMGKVSFSSCPKSEKSTANTVGRLPRNIACEFSPNRHGLKASFHQDNDKRLSLERIPKACCHGSLEEMPNIVLLILLLWKVSHHTHHIPGLFHGNRNYP